MCKFIIKMLMNSGKPLLNSDQFRYNPFNKFITNLAYIRKYEEKQSKNTSKLKQRNTYLPITDPSIAKLLLKHISDDLGNDSSVLFVANAGRTPLVNLLLKNNAKMIYAFEKNKKPFIKLEALKKKYPNRVSIFNEEILDLPDMLFTEFLNLDEEAINKWFSDIPSRKWSDEPSIKFIAAFTPRMCWKFMRFLIRILVRFEYLFSRGRTQFLLLMSGKEITYLKAKPSVNLNHYRPVSVLYNCLFDIEFIQTVPYIGTTRRNQHTPTEMNFVRLTPKKCLEQYSSEMLIDFYYFVQQTFMKRKRWVIPYLEKFFPNCGPNLIRMEIPLFKAFGDLTPQQVFELFCFFYNSTEYDTSVFNIASCSDRLIDENEDNENEAQEQVEERVEVEVELEVEKEIS